MLNRDMVIRQINQLPPSFSVDELFENLRKKFLPKTGGKAGQPTHPAPEKTNLLLEKLDGFRSLSPNWDGYDAQPPSETTIQNAEKLLLKMGSLNILPSFVGPSPNAEVMFELKKGIFSSEVYVLENEEEAILFENGDLVLEGPLEGMVPKLVQIFDPNA